MHIEKLFAPERVVAECVVVIDVMRAFTTAAFAFAAGASRIIPVSTVAEARALRDRFPDYLLMGEVDGKAIEGFDFGNSPSEIKNVDLTGHTLIQRTTAGTQGIARSLASKHILVSSFTVAEATFKRLLRLKSAKVSFVITGQKNGDEDLALADYLESKMFHQGKLDASPFLQRVISSPEGQQYSPPANPGFPQADLQAALALDAFPFAMEIFPENGLSLIYPVNESGSHYASGR